jgi:cytochrome c2
MRIRPFVALAGAALACTPPASTPAPLMQAHFGQAIDVQRAVVAGDLFRAREAARALLAREQNAWAAPLAPHAERLRSEAQRVIAAADERAAATGAAGIAAACGACHGAARSGPRLAVITTPEAGTGEVTSAMRRHAWAVERMWEGLLGPSDETWNAGAAALAQAPMYAAHIGQDAINTETQRLANEVRNTAIRGQAAMAQAERAEVLAAVLARCATCHDLVRSGN